MSVEIPSDSRAYLEQQGDAIAEKLGLDAEQKKAVSATITEVITKFPPGKDETFESWYKRASPSLSDIADKNNVSDWNKAKIVLKKDSIKADIKAHWEQIRSKVQPAAPSPESAGQKVAEGAAAQKTAKKSAAELQREMLSEGLKGTDRETIDLIAHIDTNKEAKEQSESVHRLQLVSTTLFAKIFESGVALKDVDTLEKVAKIDVTKLSINPAEKAAFDKLQEMGNAPDKKLSKEMAGIWPQAIATMRTRYESGSDAKRVIAGEQKESKDKDANVVIKFAKDHPYATAAIALAGALGIYRLFFSKNDKDKKSETEGGFFSKFSTKAMLVVVGLLIVGGLIGPEKIKDSLMKFYGTSGERISKCTDLWKKGKYKDAVMALVIGEDKHAKEYEKLAGTISKDMGKDVKDDAIQGIANAKYSEFISPESQVKGFMTQAMSQIPGMGGTIAGLFADSKDKVEQEATIREYLEKNKDKIAALNLGKDATVLEVLTKTA